MVTLPDNPIYLSRVEALLHEAGSSKHRRLQAIVWLVDMKDFEEMGEEMNEEMNEA